MKQKKLYEITEKNLTTLRAFVNTVSKLADENPIVKKAIRKNYFAAAKNALYKK
jgi:hypothetical protein